MVPNLTLTLTLTLTLALTLALALTTVLVLEEDAELSRREGDLVPLVSPPSANLVVG